MTIIVRAKGAMDLGVSSCDSSDAEDSKPDILEEAI